jgi:hypothetical protein
MILFMMENGIISEIVYRIDDENRIVDIGREWEDFASCNEGRSIESRKCVTGRSLFDFIAGMETPHLYHLLVERVRSSGRTINFDFRCDAPDRRRFLNMTMIPSADGVVEFHSRTLRTEGRENFPILQSGVERSSELVRMCSMCKKVHMPDGSWRDLEQAVAALKLLNRLPVPRISHGMCQPCYSAALASLEN